jgi:hypothetical protein
MLTTNKLTKIISGVAVLGIATAIAAPAQALTTGSLGWSNGTSDFFDDVNPGEGDTFSVTFSPDSISLVSLANGLFTPPFAPAPVPYIQILTPAVGNFAYIASGGGGNRFFYQLTSDLVFAFDNGATITWGTGTVVAGEFDDEGGSVEFELSNPPGEIGENTLPTVTGIQPYDFVLPTDVLQFGDSSLAGGGVYDAEVDVTREHVPEPGTILGLLAVGGLGLVSRFKKQK